MLLDSGMTKIVPERFYRKKQLSRKSLVGFQNKPMLEDGEILPELAQEENDLSLIEECHHLFEQLETTTASRNTKSAK